MKIAGIEQNPVNDINVATRSFPRFCYRRDFQPILDSRLRSDSGWGCCYRSSQGMLAQFCIRLKNEMPDEYDRVFGQTTDPLSLFADDPEQHFSIHSLVKAANQVGVPVGKWAKPSTISAAIKIIMESLGLGCIVTQDFKFNLDAIESTTFPCIVLIPGLFGLDHLDERFLPFLQLTFCINSSLGFISGKRDSAYYFFAMNSEEFFYFDPHVTKKFVNTENNDEYRCFYELQPKSISALSINPSILLGFFCSNKQQIKELLSILTSCSFSPISVVDNSELEEIENAVLDIDDLPIQG